MTASSSATSARFGSNSLIDVPLSPWRANLYGEPSKSGCPLMKANRWFLSSSSGHGCKWCFTSAGLSSQRILLRRRSRHVKIDDMLGFRREVRGPWSHRVVGGGAWKRIGARVALQQRRQRDRAEARLGVAEELAAGLRPCRLQARVDGHRFNPSSRRRQGSTRRWRPPSTRHNQPGRPRSATGRAVRTPARRPPRDRSRSGPVRPETTRQRRDLGGAAGRARQSRRPNASRSEAVAPPSFTIRRANACAASTYTGSFNMTNACSGVFVRVRRTAKSRGWRVERRHGGIRDRASPECVSAPISIRAGARGPRPLAVERGLPEAIGLHRKHRRPVHLAAQQAAQFECLIADGFGVEPEPRAARVEPVARVFREDFRRHPRGLPIRARRDDQPQQFLRVPTRVAIIHREPVEQFGMRGKLSLRAEILLGFNDPRAETLRPEPIHGDPR